MDRGNMVNADIAGLIQNIEKIIIGKRETIELVVTALLARGHVLIEDVPGVGKTQMVASLSNSCGGSFHRIQMTPDVMPGDITGFTMIRPGSGEMEFVAGAAFCNFLLADEVNRASAKSQSALLEVMEEAQVSVGGNTYRVPQPFMVLATQNAVETYGTYHLPEAQMDRFLMKLSMGYPDHAEGVQILQRPIDALPEKLEKVLSLEQLVTLQNQVDQIICGELMQEYIVNIAEQTRREDGIRLGVSPRGTMALQRAAKAYALMQGRTYVVPDDIQFLAPYVLAHRLMLAPQGKSKWGDAVGAIQGILAQVPIPMREEI